MQALDVRVLRSIPTPVADGLLARGVRCAGDVFAQPQALPEVLQQLHVGDSKQKAGTMLSACRREAEDAWSSADSALELLKLSERQAPVSLPCVGLGSVLGNALRPGGAILEVCGLPGTGKTQFCMQLCAAAQIHGAGGRCGPHADNQGFGEAVYIDAEGSFTAHRYAEICRALLAERCTDQKAPRDEQANVGSKEAAALETVLRRMHVCRAYDAAELYSTVKQLGTFLQSHRNVRAVVLDSIAFFFRHEFADNTAQRARVLTDIAATLRQYGKEHQLVIVLTNHMTTKFDRSDKNSDIGWLVPALGETWAHQPSTQMRFERQPIGAAPLGFRPLGRATLTKSIDQQVGRSCLFDITEAGIRDPDGSGAVGPGDMAAVLGQHCKGAWNSVR